MKNKTFTLMFVSLVALVLVASLISASISISVPQLSKTGSSVSITVQSTENETITFSGLNPIVKSGKQITFSIPAPIVVNASQPQTVTVNYNIESGFIFELGTDYSTNLGADGTTSAGITKTLQFQPNTNYCLNGDVGDLEIRDVNINNEKGFGTKDDEWYLLDNISVEVEVRNNGNDDLRQVTVAWALVNENTGEIITDDSENDFKLRNDDKETVSFSFQVDPKDFDNTDENYVLYVKAYDDDEGEDVQCAGESNDIKVIFDRDFVVLNKLKMSDATAQCGQSVQFSADVWNIGDRDQDDVSVIVLNNELKINKQFDVGNIDSLDNDKFNGIINIPANATEKTYGFDFLVYDDNGDIFQNDNNDDAKFTLPVQVTCNGGSTGTGSAGSAVVTASLVSGGKAGDQLVVKSTVTNVGNNLASYTVNIVGQNTWTDGSRVTPQSLLLNSGESGDVTISLDVNKAISGEQSFTIEVLSDGKVVSSQPVTVSIEGQGIGNIFGGSNWYLWAVGILNVILVIIIIVVAIRVARS